jgi:hypothetical protein
METTTLAITVAQLLAPFVPYLLKGAVEMGKSAAVKAGEIITEKGWEQAEKLWKKFAGHKNVEEAAKTLQQMPSDTDAEAAFRLQIKLAIMQDHDLAKYAEGVLQEYSRGNEINARGNRSVTIGGDANRNTIVTGDGNKIN